MTNQTLVSNFLKHLTERNLDSILSLFDETVDWFIPGDENKISWLGKRSTKKEIAVFYELLWRNTQPITANITNVLYDSNHVIIAGEFETRMLSSNKIVQSPFFILLGIQNDKIVLYRLLEDSYAVSNAI